MKQFRIYCAEDYYCIVRLFTTKKDLHHYLDNHPLKGTSEKTSRHILARCRQYPTRYKHHFADIFLFEECGLPTVVHELTHAAIWFVETRHHLVKLERYGKPISEKELDLEERAAITMEELYKSYLEVTRKSIY